MGFLNALMTLLLLGFALLAVLQLSRTWPPNTMRGWIQSALWVFLLIFGIVASLRNVQSAHASSARDVPIYRTR